MLIMYQGLWNESTKERLWMDYIGSHLNEQLFFGKWLFYLGTRLNSSYIFLLLEQNFKLMKL